MKITSVVIAILVTFGIAAAQPAGYKVAINVLQDQKADDYEVYTIAADGSGMKNVSIRLLGSTCISHFRVPSAEDCA